MSNLYSIDKLDALNYHTWRAKTKAILIAKEQWIVIDDEATENPSDAWKKTDQKALSTIFLLVNDSELTHIEDCETAAAAWKRLGEVFEAKGIMRRVLLKRNLLSVRLEDTSSMQEYINDVIKITRQLKEIGAPVSDEDIALTLLIGLPDSFDHLITSLEVQEKELTTQYVQGILLQHEARRKKVTSDKAFLARKKDMRNKSDIKCYHCGKPGHKSPECRKRIAEEQSQANIIKPDSIDHYDTAFTLRTTEDQVNKMESNLNSHSNTALILAKKALTFAKAARSNDGSWCIDSGATQHITSDKKLFSTYENLDPPRKVYLADNNSILAKGIGNIPIQLVVNSKIIPAVLHEVLHAPDIHDSLVSVDKMIERGHSVVFDKKGCSIYKDGILKAFATKEKGLHKLVTVRDTANIAHTQFDILTCRAPNGSDLFELDSNWNRNQIRILFE